MPWYMTGPLGKMQMIEAWATTWVESLPFFVGTDPSLLLRLPRQYLVLGDFLSQVRELRGGHSRRSAVLHGVSPVSVSAWSLYRLAAESGATLWTVIFWRRRFFCIGRNLTNLP